jgi:fructose-1,6-bisphosphatase/inositol monophosphatase family enzyme
VLSRVITGVEQAGAMLVAEFRRRPRPPGHGDHAEVDHEIERLLRAHVLALLPCRFVGEESGVVAHPDARYCWLVDPHDGTRAFLDGHRGSAISVALLQDARPVLGVVFAPLSPDRGPDLIAWMTGMDHLLRNGEPVRVDLHARHLAPGDLVFLHHEAAEQPTAHGRRVQPGRGVALPSIAYRLARVAVGDGIAAVSLSGPGAVDYAGGHALLLGAGGTLLNERAQPVTYSSIGASSVEACFGGAPAAARDLCAREWAGARDHARQPARVSLAWPRTAPEGQRDRAAGCLLGQVIGDSLGALVEFHGPEAIARLHPTGVRELRDGGVWNTVAGMGGSPSRTQDVAGSHR